MPLAGPPLWKGVGHALAVAQAGHRPFDAVAMLGKAWRQ
jgi:hypothetical protein